MLCHKSHADGLVKAKYPLCLTFRQGRTNRHLDNTRGNQLNFFIKPWGIVSYDHLKFAQKFLIGAMVILSVAICSVFVAFEKRSEEFSLSLFHQQAQVLFRQVFLIRRWVSRHDGVYAAVGPSVSPNPLLTAHCGIKALLVDRQSGRSYALLNPCLVIREFSQLTSLENGYTFHVASLTPINQAANSPDQFERESLVKFSHGATETSTIEQRPDGPVYRAMAPIYYEAACTRCHGSQGYRNGDIRGGISVAIPMQEASNRIYRNRLLAAGLAMAVLALLLGALVTVHQRFIQALTVTQTRLIELATYDPLTGMLNRRAGLERVEEELSRQYRSGGAVACLLMDIDHFKKVNDSYGHQTGDEVLHKIGQALVSCTRKHDIACRYGGEEFLMLLPDTELEAALATAEKIRGMIAALPFSFHDHPFTVTTCIGVTPMQAGEAIESLIARADQALYQAKNEGRNRVCSTVPPVLPS